VQDSNTLSYTHKDKYILYINYDLEKLICSY
jgi:hypothetical protein